MCRIKQKPSWSGQNDGGFTVLEILIAIVVMGILAAMLAPAAGTFMENAQYSTESSALAGIAQDIQNSFGATNQAVNIGMISGTGITVGGNPTLFDPDTNISSVMGTGITINSQNDWRMKEAAIRGMNFGVPVTVTQNSSALAAIAINTRTWTRILLAGPTTENSQRYLLISMMTPASRQLVFPNNAAAAAVFNDIWNNSWVSSGTTAPAAWGAELSANNYTLWNTVSSGNKTNAARLLVVQIVQPKFLLTVVNTSTVNSVQVDIGPYTNAVQIAANAAAPVVASSSIAEFTNGVPAGRMIVVRSGPAGNLVQTQQFPMTGPATITIQ